MTTRTRTVIREVSILVFINMMRIGPSVVTSEPGDDCNPVNMLRIYSRMVDFDLSAQRQLQSRHRQEDELRQGRPVGRRLGAQRQAE